jgi:hypothetical protein
MNQGPRLDCLMKQTEGRKSRDTVPLTHNRININGFLHNISYGWCNHNEESIIFEV